MRPDCRPCRSGKPRAQPELLHCWWRPRTWAGLQYLHATLLMNQFKQSWIILSQRWHQVVLQWLYELNITYLLVILTFEMLLGVVSIHIGSDWAIVSILWLGIDVFYWWLKQYNAKRRFLITTFFPVKFTYDYNPILKTPLV